MIARGLRCADEVVLRTPLLPRDVLDRWADGTALRDASDAEIAGAIAADRTLLRARLRELVSRADVREAIFVASPNLDASIEAWMREPDSDAGRKTERGLVRYLARMAARPTPFGLFAGTTVCRVGDVTRGALAERARYRRTTRLDGDYLAALTDVVAAHPGVRDQLEVRPNSSLCRVAGRLRYAQRSEGRVRRYSLVSLEPSDYLLATLSRAQHGARPGALAAALCDADAEIARDEADAFIAELIESQVLVHDLAPLVTGGDTLDDVIAQLAAIDDPLARGVVDALGATRAGLAALDRQIGNEPARYREVHHGLAALPVDADLARLFQINLSPTGDVEIAREVVDEVMRGVAVLQRVGRPIDPLKAFREAFVARYEDREVPLVEALDEEAGIGFDALTSPAADASPLLAGIPFGGAAAEQTLTWGPPYTHLQLRIGEALAMGADEIMLDDTDIDAMAVADAPPLPDALFALASVAGSQVAIELAAGPSGALLLGRFCHSDPQIAALVAHHLAAEEAQRPDAVFAEIVHLPDGRLANITARPVLRGHEIVLLGRSGAPRDRQIPITDLVIAVRGGRVVVRSVTLDREIVPRMSNAHDVSAGSLGSYRFLAALQAQQLFQLDIGPADALPYVPRIRYGRIVLRRASWTLRGQHVDAIATSDAVERVRAVRALRAALHIPRWVSVVDGDNTLPIDLDNVLALDSFAQLIKGRRSVKLEERWPDDLAIDGPDGRYANELVIPLTRTPPHAEPASARVPPQRRSSFAPGSEWLYAKLYTGRASADRVLCEAIAPLAAELPAWFFIRYADPQWHVRFRAHGDPRVLAGEVLPKLHAALRPLLDDGSVWKVQLDTYEREVARYGGPAGVELSERLFCEDSKAVLAILATEPSSDARWRLALRGIDQLLEDLEPQLAGRLAIVRSARDGFAAEHGVGRSVAMQKALGDRYRKERLALEALLDRTCDADSELAPAFAQFAARSQRLAPIIADLRAATLTVPLAQLAESYIHMHANRLLRSAQRAHELVLYDLLVRLYESRIARAKAKR